MSERHHQLSPDEWLTGEWNHTSEGDELWLSAKRHSFGEAYELLKQQHGVRKMPLNLIQLGWISFGHDDDDCDKDGEELYWRRSYRGRSYPIWYIDSDVEQYVPKKDSTSA